MYIVNRIHSVYKNDFWNKHSAHYLGFSCNLINFDNDVFLLQGRGQKMIWLIIYLVGYILAIFLEIKYVLKHRNYTSGDILVTLIVSLLSWISAIGRLLININEDTVIFKKKG